MQQNKEHFVQYASGSFTSSSTTTSVPCVFQNVPLVCPFPVRKLTVTMSASFGKLGVGSTYLTQGAGLILYAVCNKFAAPLVMGANNTTSTMEWDFVTPRIFNELCNITICASDSDWFALAAETTGGRGYSSLVPYSVVYSSSQSYFQDIGFTFTFEA